MSRQHIHGLQSIGMANKKYRIYDTRGPCQSIQSIVKPVYCRFRQIRRTYKSLRCLDVAIWRFSWQQTTDRQNRLLYPCACTRDNYTCTCTFRVEWVSPISAGVTVQMMQVLALPPSDDCNILVNLDSRNGMWALYTRREGQTQHTEQYRSIK